MLLLDANILISAFRPDAPTHARTRSWLAELDGSRESFMVPDVVSSALIRITTNPASYRGFGNPSLMRDALAFCTQMRAFTGFQTFLPGSAHWNLFTTFCSIPGVAGNHVTDAYLAAAAVDQGAELITADRGFIRFPGLRFRNPLDG